MLKIVHNINLSIIIYGSQVTTVSLIIININAFKKNINPHGYFKIRQLLKIDYNYLNIVLIKLICLLNSQHHLSIFYLELNNLINTTYQSMKTMIILYIHFLINIKIIFFGYKTFLKHKYVILRK